MPGTITRSRLNEERAHAFLRANRCAAAERAAPCRVRGSSLGNAAPINRGATLNRRLAQNANLRQPATAVAWFSMRSAGPLRVLRFSRGTSESSKFGRRFLPLPIMTIRKIGYLLTHHQSLKPSFGNAKCSVVSSGNLTTHRRCRVCVISEVGRMQDRCLESIRAQEAPQRCLKTFDDIARASNLAGDLIAVLTACNGADARRSHEVAARFEEHLVLSTSSQRANEDTGQQTAGIYALGRGVCRARTFCCIFNGPCLVWIIEHGNRS